MDVRKRSGNYIKFLTYLVVIVLINVAGITLFFRMDLTRNKMYSISEASKQVVSTLSEPLTIKVFFTKNLPAPHNNTERYLHDILEEYSAYANQYFNYRFFEVSAEEGDISEATRQNQELAKSYGIHPIQIRIIKEDEVTFQKAYMGLVLIHGDLIERIPTITSTERLEYGLTTAIQKLNNKISALLRLPEKIRIKLFFSSSLKSVAPLMRLNKLPELPENLESAVKELNDKVYGKLEFEHLDPTRDASLEAAVEKYNILSLKWPALSGGKIQPGEGAIGLLMEYRDKTINIPLIHVTRLPLIGTHYELVDMEKMEDIIVGNLESLIEINEDLGYLADHGTLKLWGPSPAGPVGRRDQDVASNFRSLVSENYTIKNVNLKDEGIPEGINCLVIARPTETFTDYELFQIDQFLMRGKTLALFLDAFNEVMPSQQQQRPPGYNPGPTYVPRNTGLEKLLEHYGIRIKKSYVMDEHCYTQQLPAAFGGGERAIYFAPLVKNEFINKDLAFMENIKGLITLKISPLELNAERITQSGLKGHKLFASSEKSWEMGGRINLNPMFIRPPQSGDEQKSLPLAYLLEGEFPSYFAGKPIPEKKPRDESPEKKEEKKEADKKADAELSKIKGQAEIPSKGKPGKILLVTSSEMVRDNLLDAKGRSPNAMFIMNVLDYLNNREDIAVMRSKVQRFNPLRDTGAGIKTFVKSLNIVGPPVMVVLFGLMVWYRRHSRKKRIHMMFQKQGRQP
jgi:ABC-2 type transport system permease protein